MGRHHTRAHIDRRLWHVNQEDFPRPLFNRSTKTPEGNSLGWITRSAVNLDLAENNTWWCTWDHRTLKEEYWTRGADLPVHPPRRPWEGTHNQ